MNKNLEKKLDRIKRNLPDLDFLSKCKSTTRKAVILKGDQDLIYAVCEIVLNVLNGNIKVEKSLLEKLKPYKNCLRKLVHKHNTLKKKKYIINQKGAGWMSFLIPPVIETVKQILNL